MVLKFLGQMNLFVPLLILSFAYIMIFAKDNRQKEVIGPSSPTAKSKNTYDIKIENSNSGNKVEGELSTVKEVSIGASSEKKLQGNSYTIKKIVVGSSVAGSTKGTKYKATLK